MEDGHFLTDLKAVIDAYRAPIIAVRDILPPRTPPPPPPQPSEENEEQTAISIQAIAIAMEGRYVTALYTSFEHYRLGDYRLACRYLVEFVKQVEEIERRHFSREVRAQLREYLEELWELSGD